MPVPGYVGLVRSGNRGAGDADTRPLLYTGTDTEAGSELTAEFVICDDDLRLNQYTV